MSWLRTWLAGSALPPQRGPVAAGMARVWMMNDDTTPMEFVVGVLEAELGLSRSAATLIMFQVHREGAASCGDFALDEAQGRVDRILETARLRGHPLQCKLEKE